MGGTALVTGGTGGLGTAVVRAMLAAGRRVVVPWIVPEERALWTPEPGLELVRADLFDADDAAECVRVAAADPERPLNAVVNLVGGFAMGARVHETSEADFRRQIELNVLPTFLVSRAALPYLVDGGGGSIVCVSSRAAVRPFPGAVGYITAKSAVLGLVGALAAEYGKDGIRSNALLPGIIDTPANRDAQPDSDRAGWVPPERIAETVVFLCGEGSSAVNGAHLTV
ncbi:NAD(P)-dependent dehydrogenase (short-subunit alcohol dehydrogenase family) [Murinocardiopsis flavida]|uniref:NAD(P)-dependent dehydrogenase (Short-subunit alcohol dehydrogenase family) n=1 Tax=Murinocardiopsis flavida TaxID=645275 RepID=A0A2P8DUM0_9ACTN|nr:SDR family NAD(P)-dependent oxidoreductase [Murinocardiopsis flavida]PSL00919.1 NAD(P)-dependent dehydrogenase (short-subunit alcohol dehydrogenase family) [Murinocardiopsis flavida]